MTDSYRPRSIRSLLTQPTGPMQRLIAKLDQLVQINQALGKHLEAPLSHHCRIADFSPDGVVFHADSPVWSARLRYRIPSILDFLRRECQLRGLVSGQIRVRVAERDTSRPQARRLTLSAATSALVQSTAVSTRDPELRAALMRLSHHTE